MIDFILQAFRTSNKSYGEWGSIFGDPIIATAILDRLLHHSTTINIRGESYRLKERRLIPLPEQQQDQPAATMTHLFHPNTTWCPWHAGVPPVRRT